MQSEKSTSTVLKEKHKNKVYDIATILVIAVLIYLIYLFIEGKIWFKFFPFPFSLKFTLFALVNYTFWHKLSRWSISLIILSHPKLKALKIKQNYFSKNGNRTQNVQGGISKIGRWTLNHQGRILKTQQEIERISLNLKNVNINTTCLVRTFYRSNYIFTSFLEKVIIGHLFYENKSIIESFYTAYLL